MSFQVNSTDLKHDTEIKESVTTAEEEFKNSRAGDTDRKLNPEDEEEFKKTRTKQLKRKLVPEDEEEFKKSKDEESDRKLNPDDEHPLDDCSGFLQPKKKRRIKYPCSGGQANDLLYPNPSEIRPINPHFKYEDDDEDKEMSRTQSMDNLLLMQKPHQSQ